jgi:hypothetical protein
MKPFNCIRLIGFVSEVVGVPQVFAWCGHRWNCYGLLSPDMLRVAHCQECSRADISHLAIPHLTTKAVLRSIRQRYKTQNGLAAMRRSGHGRKESWQQKQREFVRSLFDSNLLFDFD